MGSRSGEGLQISREKTLSGFYIILTVGGAGEVELPGNRHTNSITYRN